MLLPTPLLLALLSFTPFGEPTPAPNVLSIRSAAPAPKGDSIQQESPPASRRPWPFPAGTESHRWHLQCQPHRLNWHHMQVETYPHRCEEVFACYEQQLVLAKGPFDWPIRDECTRRCSCEPPSPQGSPQGHTNPAPAPAHAPRSHALAPRSPVPKGYSPPPFTGIPQRFQSARPQRLFGPSPHPPPPPAGPPLLEVAAPPRYFLVCRPHLLDWQNSRLGVRADWCEDIFQCFGREVTQVRGQHDVVIQGHCESFCACEDRPPAVEGPGQVGGAPGRAPGGAGRGAWPRPGGGTRRAPSIRAG